MTASFYKKFTLILFSCSWLYAENILEIYNEALENDPTYRAAEYSYLADKQLVVQGRAALMPSITLSGSTNWNEYYQTIFFNKNIIHFQRLLEYLNLYSDWILGLILKGRNL